jgi:hypothetical protein
VSSNIGRLNQAECLHISGLWLGNAYPGPDGNTHAHSPNHSIGLLAAELQRRVLARRFYLSFHPQDRLTQL